MVAHFNLHQFPAVSVFCWGDVAQSLGESEVSSRGGKKNHLDNYLSSHKDVENMALEDEEDSLQNGHGHTSMIIGERVLQTPNIH